MAVVDSAGAGQRAAARGASILQLRAPELSARALEHEAIALVADSTLPVIVNSRCDIAMAAGAAGVHLPEHDIPTAGARWLLGDRLVGRSAHSIEAALLAEADGADYVIFGPIFATTSHVDRAPVGIEALAEVCRRMRVPVLAIGGITSETVNDCRRAGAAGIAAIRMFQ